MLVLSSPSRDQTQASCIGNAESITEPPAKSLKPFFSKQYFLERKTSIKLAIMPLVGEVLRRGFPGGSVGEKNLSAM